MHPTNSQLLTSSPGKNAPTCVGWFFFQNQTLFSDFKRGSEFCGHNWKIETNVLMRDPPPLDQNPGSTHAIRQTPSGLDSCSDCVFFPLKSSAHLCLLTSAEVYISVCVLTALRQWFRQWHSTCLVLRWHKPPFPLTSTLFSTVHYRRLSILDPGWQEVSKARKICPKNLSFQSMWIVQFGRRMLVSVFHDSVWGAPPPPPPRTGA